MAPSAIADHYRYQTRPYGKAQIQASVLVGPKHLVLESRTVPSPGPHELQIEVKATGICGSDVSYYNKFRNGDLHVKERLTLGHESAGVVVAIGEQVAGFTIGDRVALEVGVPYS